MNTQICNLCGSKKKNKLFKKYGYDIVKCQNCGFVYTDFKPSKKFLRDYYQTDYFEKGERKHSYNSYADQKLALQKTFKHKIKKLYLHPKGTVLDIGCAYGFFISEVPRSWIKYGVEISKHAVMIARNKNPQAIIKEGVLTSNLFSSNKFNLITLWDVVEHLNNPKESLNIVYKKLKNGGKVVLTTGDVGSFLAKTQKINWHLYNPPQHLSYFSAQTITQLLKETGFKEIKISHPPSYYSISYLLHKINNLYLKGKFKLNFSKDLSFPVNLWDIMMVEATKK
jgi:2-polyprenyl-3-methyl-5-hydroxy-6-metoxy-1,4-benzoquinol methylase